MRVRRQSVRKEKPSHVGAGVRRRRANSPRRGAAAVETAIVMLVLLTLIFGMLELTIAIFHYHIVAQGARQGARLAIVRGKMAPPELPEWGPTAIIDIAADSTVPVAVAMQPYLTGLDLSVTKISVEWPDGSTQLESPVRFTVTTDHEPFVTFLFTSGWTLTGQSTMPIAH